MDLVELYLEKQKQRQMLKAKTERVICVNEQESTAIAGLFAMYECGFISHETLQQSLKQVSGRLTKVH